PHLRQSMLRKPPHILITTPESVYLLLTSERGRELFPQVKYIIVDEIHSLAGNKRGVHLSLSLERLMALTKDEPVRIGLSATQKPLERIAAFLGGQKYDGSRQRFQKREVAILDCGQRKDMDVRVISPVDDFSDVPEATVWPAVVEKIYSLVLQHKSTLVFVNMRAQAEKLARQLNELHHQKTVGKGKEFALVHHGSISREARYEIEAKLKNGKIPVVVATASLELGIDIGSIDLVIQLESPRSVTSALQRVGRSGHLLRSTSKGIIIPFYRADLDDAASTVRDMKNTAIEETQVPENCLDVLSQQVIAEVAMRSWDRKALYLLFCQSYCYRHLSEPSFNRIIDMLAGRFENRNLQALQPRLAWDKVNDRLIARRGTRLNAVLNGGTIADRGYFGVYLEGSNTRLGEVEEEFVFESRIGDVFFLGNNEWRINQITRDKILVTPLASVKPRPPFWKAEPLYRDFSSSLHIGSLRREVGGLVKERSAIDFLKRECHTDDASAVNLQAHLKSQLAHTGVLPTDDQVVVEWFRDAVNEPQVVIHAPFGGRVNGAWAITLAAAMENNYGIEVQYTFNDDGIIIRLLDQSEPPSFEDLFAISPKEAERLLLSALHKTPMFITRFRHIAMRALLLPRSRVNKRIPLWLQRLRASDLLQAVRDYPEFPVIAETYRECLRDVLDIKGLEEIMRRIQEKHIAVHIVHTPSPSPMASGLLFRFLSEHLYEYDRHRAPALASGISSELLADIMSRQEIPQIIGKALAEEAERVWQYLAQDKKARDVETLFEVIDKLGPLDEKGLDNRVEGDLTGWLDALKTDKRIASVQWPDKGWVTAENKHLYHAPSTPDHTAELLRRFFSVRGPRSFERIQAAIPVTDALLHQALDKLCQDKEIIKGQLLAGEKMEQWCDRQNFAFLYRKAVAARRQVLQPATSEDYYAFFLAWHKLTTADNNVSDILRMYGGHPLPVHVFEREILRARLGSNESQKSIKETMMGLISSGDLIVRARREDESGRLRIDFLPRGGGSLYESGSSKSRQPESMDENSQKVFRFLQNNGASFFRDILQGCGMTSMQTEKALSGLAKDGLVSCDHYDSLLVVLQKLNHSDIISSSDWHRQIRSSWSVGLRSHRPAGSKRHEAKERYIMHQGRWFLISSFAVQGAEMDASQRAVRQARLLLDRYGIVVKEWYRRESGLLPWYVIFQQLKRMEWSGEAKRGFFIHGLSGAQFALPEAAELLEKIRQGTSTIRDVPVLLCAVDPALPFGGVVSWDIKNAAGERLAVTKLASNHFFFAGARPVVYCEAYASRLWLTDMFRDEDMPSFAREIKRWFSLLAPPRPINKLVIGQVDGEPVVQSRFNTCFQNEGFEQEGDKLVLWPSKAD
ncbi:hypothetical protein A2V82_06510, partial [candidate division KSB1 bacterium RBG_16_48_16]